MKNRRALIIGIDHYDNVRDLRCAVSDAKRIEQLISRNDNGGINYKSKIAVSGSGQPKITRSLLRQMWTELFHDFDGDILFYFSGHGAQTIWGGCLVTQDGTEDELGASMEDLLLLANRSNARDVILILDCCHSGELGNPPILQGLQKPLALLREGITVLAASRPDELAYEIDGHGVFSNALAEGLDGGAADHMGQVSAASLFLYAERLFDAWDQSPVYKSHTNTVSTIRSCKPPIELGVLRKIQELFESAEHKIRLDPEYESEELPDEDNPNRAQKREDARIFKILRDTRLLESATGEDLYWAAMNSSEIQLTNLGKYYWRLLDQNKI